jgi:hypothetical protein
MFWRREIGCLWFLHILYCSYLSVSIHPIPKMLDDVGIGSLYEGRKSIWGKPRDLSRGNVQPELPYNRFSGFPPLLPG